MAASERRKISDGRGGAGTSTSSRLPPRPPVPEGFKWCPRCGQVKPVDDFFREKRRKSGRSSRCKRCQLLARRESDKRHPLTEEQRERRRQAHARWRARNRDKVREQHFRRKTDDARYRRVLERARLRSAEKRYLRMAVINEIKRQMGCLFCSEREPICLDMHHAIPGEKLFMATGARTRPWPVVRAEAAKCIVLCANCHRRVHHGLLELPPDAPRVRLPEEDHAAAAGDRRVDGTGGRWPAMRETA